MSTDLSRWDAIFVKPEQRLLRCCASTAPGSEVKTLIRDLLRQQMDWTYLLDIAHDHGVMPILYRSLNGADQEKVPTHFLESLQMRYLGNASRNLRFARTLLEVVDLLESQGIPSVPLKGPVLAASAYGNLSLRQFGDLDILVHRQDVLRAKHLFTSMGYVNSFGLTREAEDALIRYQKDFQLISPGLGTVVELHWSLEPGKRFRHFCDETVWKRLTEVPVEGRHLRSLGPEDSLLYLCLHGANHRWDRLCWISNVAQTIHRYPDLDWDLLVEQAFQLQCRRILFLGLALAGILLDASLPPEIAGKAIRYPGVGKITELVIDRIFSAPPNLSELRRSFSFHLMVSESWEAKIRLCGRRIVFPDAVDFGSSKLPPWLYFLLPLLRPIRLMAQHSPWHLLPVSWRR